MDSAGKRAASKAASDKDKIQHPTKKTADVTNQVSTTTTTKQTAPSEDNVRPRRKAFVDATANMKPQPKQLPNNNPSKTKTKTTKSSKTKSLATKPSPPAFTNYPAAILIAIGTLEQQHAIKKGQLKPYSQETIEMKLLLPSSLIIKHHIMMNMPDGMSYEDDKFQDALSFLTSKDIIEVNDCIYSVVDGKTKVSSKISAEMNDRFGLRALPFVGKNDLLPAGINYSKLSIELLTRVHPNASVPDEPIVGDDGLAETPGENILLTWHMAQIVAKVMAVEKLDVDTLMDDLGLTLDAGERPFKRFLRMVDPSKDACNRKTDLRTDPTTAFQDSTWYKPLVRKMAALINGMDDKDKKDCLSLWTDGEIQLSNFQFNPSLDISQFLSYASCTARVQSHSENEVAAYFDINDMHGLGMFRGLPSKINNALLLEIMTGRKHRALMEWMRKARKKENEERSPRHPLPQITTSRGSYTEQPNPNQIRLLNIGKYLDLIAKEVAVKSHDSENEKMPEKSAESLVKMKQTTDQNKKDRDDKLEKVLPKVLRVLGISSVLRGSATAPDCAQAMVTLAGLFELNNIHEGLNGVYLGDFLGRIFGKDGKSRQHFFRSVEKVTTESLCKEWKMKSSLTLYKHQSSAKTSAISSDMMAKFSKEFSMVQSKEAPKEAEGDSDEDKKPAAKRKRKGGDDNSAGKKKKAKVAGGGN